MWKAYLHILKERVPDTINILDKFHIMQKMGKALDSIRAQEVKRFKKEGNDVIFKNSRWCFLKRIFNLTKPQKGKLKELVSLNLNIVKAFGFRSFEVMETALYHQLGNLPEPTFKHEFW